MNQYRFVEYGDDGHVLYQCLTCKKFLPAAGNYCMYCGVKFDAEATCRPRECPAWAWRKWGTDWKDHYWLYRSSRTARPDEGKWVVETREQPTPAYRHALDHYQNFDAPDWRWVTSVEVRSNCSAHAFHQHLLDHTHSLYEWPFVQEGCVSQHRFVRVVGGRRIEGPPFAAKSRPLTE